MHIVECMLENLCLYPNFLDSCQFKSDRQRRGVCLWGFELEHNLDVLKIAERGIYIENTLELPPHPDFVNSFCDRQLL